jgi:hypothetical protein
MTEYRRLENIEKKLDAHSEKLDVINNTLQTIAVQDERIKTLSRDLGEIKPKLEAACQFQASCPRGQIKFLWIVVAPMGFSLLVLGFRLIAG